MPAEEVVAGARLVSPLPSAVASMSPSTHPSLFLLSGAVAGLSVDCVLFPLDTIKTRMQSKTGLKGAGGFGKLFAGIASAAAGSGQCIDRQLNLCWTRYTSRQASAHTSSVCMMCPNVWCEQLPPQRCFS